MGVSGLGRPPAPIRPVWAKCGEEGGLRWGPSAPWGQDWACPCFLLCPALLGDP